MPQFLNPILDSDGAEVLNNADVLELLWAQNLLLRGMLSELRRLRSVMETWTGQTGLNLEA